MNVVSTYEGMRGEGVGDAKVSNKSMAFLLFFFHE